MITEKLNEKRKEIINDAKEKQKEIKNAAINQWNGIITNHLRNINPYSVGDVVTDHIGMGRIDKIIYVLTDLYDELGSDYTRRIVYKCTVLTKKGVPTKRPRVRNIHLSNIVESNK